MVEEKSMPIAPVLFVCAGLLLGAMAFNTSKTEYYIPAEIGAENETSVYFGTEEGHIFYITKCGITYPDTVPYMLQMDSMGTKDVTDDEIIVAWRSVD